MKVKLALAQMNIKAFDIEANIKKADEMIGLARNKGCHIIAFPELFITGLVEHPADYAQPIPGNFTDIFCKLAAENGIHIVMGSMNEKHYSRIYNTSTLIDDSGNIIGKYRKNYLWANERNDTDADNNAPVFDTRFGKIGLEICWDLAFPELTKEMTLKGARIIFNSSLWSYQDKYDIIWNKPRRESKTRLPDIDSESIFVNTCISARAIENGIIYAFTCGCGGHEYMGSTRELLGQSQIAAPFYGKIASLNDREDLLIKTVDLEITELAEAVYEIRKDSRNRCSADNPEHSLYFEEIIKECP